MSRAGSGEVASVSKRAKSGHFMALTDRFEFKCNLNVSFQPTATTTATTTAQTHFRTEEHVGCCWGRWEGPLRATANQHWPVAEHFSGTNWYSCNVLRTPTQQHCHTQLLSIFHKSCFFCSYFHINFTLCGPQNESEKCNLGQAINAAAAAKASTSALTAAISALRLFVAWCNPAALWLVAARRGRFVARRLWQVQCVVV